MDGGGATGSRRRSFKERLRLTGISCCGAVWGLAPSTMVGVNEEEINHPSEDETEQFLPPPLQSEHAAGCGVVRGPPPPGTVNLATALAAEREFRAPGQGVNSVVGESPSTPRRVSLMRLLAEPIGGDGEAAAHVAAVGEGSGLVCCVCMVRKKGAAFIPCGHTFCRVCSRELWVNRGTCPLCNRPIAEILDIF
uniref:RING-type domain-containing protein n=1 Tax=Kalanchoe fedtschenkoi TaxID=63787 RepID=A0A7N1A2M3_KALFE